MAAAVSWVLSASVPSFAVRARITYSVALPKDWISAPLIPAAARPLRMFPASTGAWV